MTQTHWTLDKRVPLALIITIVTQLFGFGWIAAKMDSRISSLEDKERNQSSIIASIVTAQSQTNVALAEIKKDQNYTVESLREIKATLKHEKN